VRRPAPPKVKNRLPKCRRRAVDELPVRLKRGEIAVALLGVAFAAVFVFSNTSGLGFALLAADALWVVTRIEIVERHDQPGRYTTLRCCLAS
jgi:hypothetical protein